MDAGLDGVELYVEGVDGHGVTVLLEPVVTGVDGQGVADDESASTAEPALLSTHGVDGEGVTTVVAGVVGTTTSSLS